jgi:diacylglycerol kinase (ATP)
MPKNNEGSVPNVNSSKAAGDNPVRHVLRAGVYSLHGIGAALKHEMAFRLEAGLFVVLAPVAMLLPIDWVLRGLVVGSMMLVLVVELLNSAVEWTVDYVSTERHPYAKRAKDIGSAAVALAAAHSALWWLLAVVQTIA